jgi:hypothetical protein
MKKKEFKVNHNRKGMKVRFHAWDITEIPTGTPHYGNGKFQLNMYNQILREEAVDITLLTDTWPLMRGNDLYKIEKVCTMKDLVGINWCRYSFVI